MFILTVFIAHSPRSYWMVFAAGAAKYRTGLVLEDTKYLGGGGSLYESQLGVHICRASCRVQTRLHVDETHDA